MQSFEITQSMIDRAAKIFARKADRNEIYITSDGQLFTKQGDAQGQAGNLKSAGKSSDVKILERETTLANATKTAGAPNTPTAPPAAAVPGEGDQNISPLEIARALAKERAGAIAKGEADVVKAKEQLEGLRNEKATLPTDASKSKLNGINKRIETAEQNVSKAEEALTALKEKGEEANKKVKELEAGQE